MDRGITMPVHVTAEESKAITDYCNQHGYKKARWAKSLMLREITRMNGQGDGSAQARDMAATIGGQG